MYSTAWNEGCMKGNKYDASFNRISRVPKYLWYDMCFVYDSGHCKELKNKITREKEII